MKTIGEISANVILTFEEGDQEFYSASAYFPNVPLQAVNKLDVEIDVLEQFLCASEEEMRFNQLVKISLCYDSGSIDMNKCALIDFLIRDGAKYYFQPDQRGPVEEALMMRVSRLASKTKVFVDKRYYA